MFKIRQNFKFTILKNAGKQTCSKSWEISKTQFQKTTQIKYDQKITIIDILNLKFWAVITVFWWIYLQDNYQLIWYCGN